MNRFVWHNVENVVTNHNETTKKNSNALSNREAAGLRDGNGTPGDTEIEGLCVRCAVVAGGGDPGKRCMQASVRPRSTPSATVMFRTRSDSNETGGNLSQNWKPFQQSKHQRQRIFAMRSLASNHAAMNKDLHSLNEAGRPFAARLHFIQVVHGNRTTS